MIYEHRQNIFWFCFSMSSSKGYRNAQNNLPISLFLAGKSPSFATWYECEGQLWCSFGCYILRRDKIYQRFHASHKLPENSPRFVFLYFIFVQGFNTNYIQQMYFTISYILKTTRSLKMLLCLWWPWIPLITWIWTILLFQNETEIKWHTCIFLGSFILLIANNLHKYK